MDMSNSKEVFMSIGPYTRFNSLYVACTRSACAILFAIFACPAYSQDVITFQSGNTVSGLVTSFSDGLISVSIDGEIKKAPISNIKAISFRVSTDPSPEVIKAMIPQVKLEAKSLSLQKGLTPEQRKENREQGVQFLAVAVVVSAIGSEPVEIAHGTFKLRDSDGIEYQPSTWGLDMLQEISKKTLSTGETTGGWVGFSIPARTDMSKLMVRYENSEMKSDWINVPRPR
jgi:hypothetical protein